MTIAQIKQVRNAQIRPTAGFTLVEMLIAMTMFLVIGGATLGMFAQHASLFGQQQGTAGLNIALQNAITQVQLDLVNAGTGYYPGMVIPSWPIGATITNQTPSSPCNDSTTFTYSATCFDTLNILTLNPNIIPAHPTDSTGSTAATACSKMTSSPFYIQPDVIAGKTVAQELTLTAAQFSQGDKILVVTSGGGGGSHQGPNDNSSNAGASGALYDTLVLTGAPTIGANYVSLPFDPPTGTNSSGVSDGTYTSAQEGADDPLGIAGPTDNANPNIGVTFCANDWVMKLEPTTYQVDSTTNPQNPTLQRVQGGVASTIAEQIIGFKVGGATEVISTSTSTDVENTFFSFFAKNKPTDNPPGYNNNFSLIRSLRITLLGRTTPNPQEAFRNTFDGGPYQVLDTTVVVNPRNMTMNGN